MKSALDLYVHGLAKSDCMLTVQHELCVKPICFHLPFGCLVAIWMPNSATNLYVRVHANRSKAAWLLDFINSALNLYV